jgi:hypothetical protein
MKLGINCKTISPPTQQHYKLFVKATAGASAYDKFDFENF